MSYTYKYPMQTVAADAVVFSNREILLIKRNTEPCKGLYALPGGHLDSTDRNAKETADRELKEETGVDANHRTVVLSGEVGSFSQIDRDPRGRYISIVYYYLLSERPEITIDPEEVQAFKWVKFNDIDPKKIAFDHYEIMQKAIQKLAQDLRFEQ
jgi:8-oxo-dGTP diphosphatase